MYDFSCVDDLRVCLSIDYKFCIKLRGWLEINVQQKILIVLKKKKKCCSKLYLLTIIKNDQIIRIKLV